MMMRGVVVERRRVDVVDEDVSRRPAQHAGGVVVHENADLIFENRPAALADRLAAPFGERAQQVGLLGR